MKPLTLKDAEFVRKIFEKYPPVFSEFTFSNLMMWREQRPTYIQEINGTVQFLIEAPELIAFGPTFGPHEILPQLPVRKIIRTSLPAEELPGWQFAPAADDADYVYKVSDLVHYHGHRYHRKRQLMHGCSKRYECTYEPLTLDLIPECLDLQKRIIQMTPPTESQLREHRAARRLLTEFAHFHYFGGVIRIEDTVEGFMVASRLNATTAVGHVVKSNPEIHGISALLHHWFAEKALPDFTYFNVEQDLGIPGLRESKERFIPDHMVVKYTGLKL